MLGLLLKKRFGRKKHEVEIINEDGKDPVDVVHPTAEYLQRCSTEQFAREILGIDEENLFQMPEVMDEVLEKLQKARIQAGLDSHAKS